MSNDWANDESTSFEDKMAHFESLEDVEIIGPPSSADSIPGGRVSITAATPNIGVVVLQPVDLPTFTPSVLLSSVRPGFGATQSASAATAVPAST